MNIIFVLGILFSKFCCVVGLGAPDKLARYIYRCEKGELGNALDRTWYSKHLLAHCEQHVMCSKDFFVYVSSPPHHHLVEEYFLPGTTFFLRLDSHDPYNTPEVRALIAHAHSVNRTLKDYILVHVSDLQWQHTPAFATFYDEWRYVLRNFYWANPVLRAQFSKGRVSYLPLGYSSPLWNDGRMHAHKPIQNRTSLLSFVGNRKTGNKFRAVQVKEVEASVGMAVTGAVNEASFGHGSRSAYKDALVDAKFCLTLPSRYMETHRLYDALEVGCIPVVVDRFKSADFTDKNLEQLRPLLTMPWTDSAGRLIRLDAATGRSPAGLTEVATKVSADVSSQAGLRTVVERLEMVTSTPKAGGSGSGAPVMEFKSSSYHAFNNGGGGVNILPFVYVASTADLGHTLAQLQADPAVMRRVQTESTVWWQQTKLYYQRLVENKVCVATRGYAYMS
mgnify:CR=1 FL=1